MSALDDGIPGHQHGRRKLGRALQDLGYAAARAEDYAAAERRMPGSVAREEQKARRDEYLSIGE